MIYLQLAPPIVALAAFVFALVLFLRDRRLAFLVVPLLCLVLLLDTLPPALPIAFEESAALQAVLHLLLSSLALGVLAFVGRTRTERLAEKRERMAGEARTTAILDAAVDVVILIDRRGIIQMANPALERLLGFAPSDVLGRNVSVLMGSPMREEHDSYLANYQRTGQAKIIGIGRDVEALHKDGRSVPVRLSVSRVEVEGDLYFAGILHDLTDLHAKAAELERSNHDLQQFAYVASHDLQEPLRMISSYLQLIARRYRGRLDQDADDFIDFAVGGAKRMQTLINDLLAYSRVGTHGGGFADVDLNLVVSAVLADLDVAIRESGAVVDAGELPVLAADETQMRQLFLNLIGNAIKFRKPGTPPRVTIRARRERRRWLISVADDGIGLDEKFRDRIFVIFQRLHSTEEYPGTGIGLALCRRIVERHGGRISVDSRPGEGTTFTVSLPDPGGRTS